MCNRMTKHVLHQHLSELFSLGLQPFTLRVCSMSSGRYCQMIINPKKSTKGMILWHRTKPPGKYISVPTTTIKMILTDAEWTIVEPLILY